MPETSLPRPISDWWASIRWTLWNSSLRIELEFQLLGPDEDLPDFISLEATARYLRARLSA